VLSSLNARKLGSEEEWTTGVKMTSLVIASNPQGRRVDGGVVSLGSQFGVHDTDGVFVDVETHEMVDPTKSTDDWDFKRSRRDRSRVMAQAV
jgi:hypothetical protein